LARTVALWISNCAGSVALL